MRIFVTGGTGSLGEHLIPELVKENYHLVVLTRETKPSFSNNIQYITGDLLDADSYEYVLNNIDLILHMAAVTHTNNEALYYKVNTEGTILLKKLAERLNIKRFILMSSRAISEEGGDYCVSKKMAENAIIESKLNWVILRPAEIYGLSQGEAITKLVELIHVSPIIPIIGNGLYKFAPVHVNDIISAIINVIKNDCCTGKIYNLSGPEDMTYLKLIEKIENVLNVRKIKIRLPIFLIKIIAELISWGRIKKAFIVKDQIPRLLCQKSADISLAMNDLEYHPIDINTYAFSIGRR